MKKEKIVIKPIELGNCFLKTPDEVAKLFGFQTSSKYKIKQAAKVTEQDLKISNRSLNYLEKEGITADKYKKSIEPILNEYQKRSKLNLSDLIPDGTKITD